MQGNTSGRRRVTAFTLVELLVVIGIISVLIAILLPSLSKARAQAREVQCMSNMHQWGLGYAMYADQNQGVLPMKAPDGTPGQPFTLPTSAATAEISWTDASGPHWVAFPVGIDDPGLFFNAIPSMIGGKSYYRLLLDDKNKLNPLPVAGTNNMFVCPASAAPSVSVGAAATDSLYPTDPNYYQFFGSDSSGQLLPTSGSNSFKGNMNYVVSSNLMDLPTSPGAAYVYKAKLSQLNPSSSIVVMCEKIASAGEYLDGSIQQWAHRPDVVTAGLGNNIKSYGYKSGIAQLGSGLV